MAQEGTRPQVRKLYQSDKPRRQKSFSNDELRIRRLERICHELEEKPVLAAGVSSQEILEILKSEQQRLRAASER